MADITPNNLIHSQSLENTAVWTEDQGYYQITAETEVFVFTAQNAPYREDSE